MALSGNTTYVLRPGLRESASRIQQVLHDNGLLLGGNHAVPDICVYLHHCEVDPDRDQR